MICTDVPAPIYLFFSDSVPSLLYYSHIPTSIVVLLLASLVFFRHKNLVGKILFALSITFISWILLNLILWTNVNASIIVFVWSLFGIIYPAIFFLTAYFVYVFIKKQDAPFSLKVVFIVAMSPLLLLLNNNVNAFNLPYCEAIEGTWFNYYNFAYVFVIYLATLIFGIKEYLKEKTDFRVQILLITIGAEAFLTLFFVSALLSSYLAEQGYLFAFELEQYGIFGMTFFIAVLAFLIVKYKAFNIKLIGAQALMVSLWFLVGSLLFVAVSNTTRIIAGVTLLFTTIAGYFLIRSVRREVALREQVEDLVVDINKANDRLKVLDKMKSEFVSIASHQLRSPLTSIRGYASMLAEGSYGKLPEKAQEAASNIAESSKYMALSIEDYLNVSRIEAGNMKYELSDFNLKETVEKIVDEMRPTAMKKGLVMMFRSDCSGSCAIHADIGKTRQVIMNLLDNSMKYTPKGTITVLAHDDVKAKKMYVTIQDTGVGMSKETQSEVFDKFVRAKNANQINVTGTGLGLFVAKKMVTEMQGKVWAESEGEGMGSKFHIEFPMVAGKVSIK